MASSVIKILILEHQLSKKRKIKQINELGVHLKKKTPEDIIEPAHSDTLLPWGLWASALLASHTFPSLHFYLFCQLDASPTWSVQPWLLSWAQIQCGQKWTHLHPPTYTSTFPLGFCYKHHLLPIAEIQTYIWIWCAIYCLGNLQVISLQASVFSTCEMGKQDYKSSKNSFGV